MILTASQALTPEELSRPIWDADLCARYLMLAYRTFAEKTSYDPTFPEAARLGSGPKAPRRWKSALVRQWAGETEYA